jgi:GT2 family glycosyltransferase/glycosyltransferase involved in cell wall biosynthesis/tetratricopeptide (TPR) repeat protein
MNLSNSNSITDKLSESFDVNNDAIFRIDNMIESTIRTINSIGELEIGKDKLSSTFEHKINTAFYNFTGALDICGPLWIAGWVQDKNQPDLPVEIIVTADENIIYQGLAEDFRQDLLDAGLGNGKHGFNIQVPFSLYDGLTHVIEIREIKNEFFLPNTPQTFCGDSTSCFIFGEHEREKGNFDVAIRAYRLGYSLDNANLPVIERLGQVLLHTGNNKDALDCFGYALELKDPPDWAYIGAAKAAEGLGDVASALEFLLIVRPQLAVPSVNFDKRIIQNFWKLSKDKKFVYITAVQPCLICITSLFSPLLIRVLCSDYTKLNPDINGSELTPLEHFALFGIPEQRPISYLFEKEHLIKIANEKGINLEQEHYSNIFFRLNNENILPNSWLSIDYLRETNESYLRTSPQELLSAIFSGKLENIHPLFDVNFYLSHSKLLGITVEGVPFFHYLRSGWKLGVDPHPLFDTQYYLTDVLGSKRLDPDESPLIHFLTSKNESRFSPSPFIDLLHLRHCMSIEGYSFISDGQLIADAFSLEWISLNRLIHRSMISLMLISNESQAIQYPDVLLIDFIDLICQIRLGSISLRSDSLDFPITYPLKIEPKVSIIILNYNKFLYTLLSVYSACRAGQSVATEIIIADNGSESFQTELLFRYTRHLPNVRIMAIKENRFFGEGNNLAIDQADGEYIFLLNNDAVLGQHTLDQLLNSVESDSSIGAIAPVIVLPDSRLQEVGGTILGSGQIVQRDKYMEFEDYVKIKSIFPAIQAVDYASAACLMLRRSTLDRVLGFDVSFDPFYFEDTDLCARISAQGFRIVVQRSAFAMHVENGSTKELLGNRWLDLISRQRLKFSNRWQGIYEGLSIPEVAAVSEHYNTFRKYEIVTAKEMKPGYSQKPIAWVYSPFDIRVGGGERYILSVASGLSDKYEVWFLTQQRISRARLSHTLEDLAIKPGRFHYAKLEDTANWPRPDLYFVMGNEIEPPTSGFGKRNIFHIQFPFPIHYTGHFSIERVTQYDAFVVNSEFTAYNVAKAMLNYKVPSIPVHILNPPVSMRTCKEQDLNLNRMCDDAGYLKIVNVGRYIVRGHNKRQDIVMDIAEECYRLGLPVSFEFYGGLGVEEENTKYFSELSDRGSRIKAKVHANVSRSIIENALNTACIYIHPCGLGYYPGSSPEKLEHFGITIVEAMSRGCIPLVYDQGGPAEIIRNTNFGFTFSKTIEAVNQIKLILKDPELINFSDLDKLKDMYSDDTFFKNLLQIDDQT